VFGSPVVLPVIIEKNHDCSWPSLGLWLWIVSQYAATYIRADEDTGLAGHQGLASVAADWQLGCGGAFHLCPFFFCTAVKFYILYRP
jgi:hypothetical protein